jgi:hypothetical protein
MAKDGYENIFTGRCSPIAGMFDAGDPDDLPASSNLHSTGENERFTDAPQGH